MKTLNTFIIIIAFSFFSCNKDDEATKNNDLVFENLNSVNIPDKTDTFPELPITSEINVTATGTLKDLSKFTLEMNIEHNYQRDLQFELIAPDGTAKTFIYRRGLAGKYLANQKLRFNSTFTNQLSDDGIDFLSGNYKECKGSISNQVPALDPIFQFLINKNINGIWKLRATDWEVVNSGSIKSWRLVFNEGAL